MKLKMISLGCKVNQYEGRAIAEQFRLRGWEETSEIADLCIINTCTVTTRADAKSREAILRAKRQNQNALIAVCGCLTQLNGGAIKKLGVDFVIPQEKKHLLADIVTGVKNPIAQSRQKARNIWSLTIDRFHNIRAFLKIQDGCSNACAFCKIPHIRGVSQSRTFKDTLREAKRLSTHHPEIVLCGINLGLYGRDLTPPMSLAVLVKRLLALPSLGRLRISSLEPRSISKELLRCFQHQALCPHIHLPFQSGDDTVLSAMNKKDTVAHYEAVVDAFRAKHPHGAVSCDIMVGFPNETETAFKNTVDFLKRIKPMRTHVFAFSPREKTPLWNIPVPNQKILKARSRVLTSLGRYFAHEYALQCIGKKLHIVTEEFRNHETCGYTENYLKVCVQDKIPLGAITPVRIARVTNSKIFAVLEK
ncbi:MAG: MiaB/RimO family radical SAM methylthiotransferase [Candidatus Omnitrophota bacterium]|nr:MiaB/RimO family radical SAM methylthiotransferase [Candidatus Omnitrophota bacterium]